jgi:hypothetical protein
MASQKLMGLCGESIVGGIANAVVKPQKKSLSRTYGRKLAKGKYGEWNTNLNAASY